MNNGTRITVRVRCRCGAVIECRRVPCGRPTVRCEDCRKADARARAKAWNAANSKRKRDANAEWVRANAETQRESARSWARRNRANVTSNTQNYRARKLAAFVEPVDRDIVYVLHGGVCGICGRDADPEDFEVDHVVPLSKGGEHSYANVQPAHPVCNRRKNARLAFVGVTP